MYNQSNTNMFNSQQQAAFLDMSSSSQRTSSESDMGRNIIDSESTGNETVEAPPSGDDQDLNQQVKRGRYYRHTQRQIDEMESLFKESPHPDDKQRKALGLSLGLEPLQIKFWFQNKRTQVKSQHERHENNLLRAENEKLREDNAKYKEVLSSSACPNCGGPSLPNVEMSLDEQRLRIENARLRQEVDKMSAISAKYGLKPANSYYNVPSSQNNVGSLPVEQLGVGNTLAAQTLTFGEIYGGSYEPLNVLQSPILSVSDKAVIAEHAVAAMEELTRLALSGEPMWIPGNYGMEILNQDEYLRNFPRGIVSNAMGLKPETSRQSAVIIMNHVKLVEILMDVNQWSKMFCGIVTRATTGEVLSTGVAGNYNGALQMMSAEFQVPSPFVRTRMNHFVRYCKQHSEESWVIVDFPVDHLKLTPGEIIRGRRRPSGCIIQDLPNGYSKVIWIEHAEVDNSEVHCLYKILVNSALGFGAKRWVATLDRQCERLASSMATNIPAGDLCGVITSHEGRTSILKLAERMILSFCTAVGAAVIHPWLPITRCDNVRVMSRKILDDPGRPSGIVLSASTSLWLSIPAKRVFDFLRDETNRNLWDILSNGGIVHELAHMANGRDPGNSLSLLRVNGPNSAHSSMIILQESRTDVTGSYVVYAPVDLAAFNTVLSGSDPDYVALLPSGFAILPDGPELRNGGPIVEVGSGGCLLTIGFQILVDSGPSAKLSLSSVNTVETLIKCTVGKIKNAIVRDTAP